MDTLQAQPVRDSTRRRGSRRLFRDRRHGPGGRRAGAGTRELSQLARQGLLKRAGRVFLLGDVAALEKLVADFRPEENSALAEPEEASRVFTLGGSQRQLRAVLVADVLDSTVLRERDE